MTKTFDQRAVELLLRGDKKGLTALADQAAVHHGLQCPDCGAGEERMEDNGGRGTDLTFLCSACGHQWSPNV